ncbi:Ankyrin repeat-containing protein ITN1 [Vitis vinifera]|uniref:Ankyrin repeat-containing protein ITN1 n=1 Tax=Vitis vinifera TaxID=29760 RepID=A0A438EDL0_VITVI|nr:Ankyrin repeat-containing protein ITN1 [Vitis vinifera]
MDAYDDKLNRELYKALMKGDEKEVIQLCLSIPEGPVHIMTIHMDTVLHMATYSKQADLVLKLLENLPETHLNKLTLQNDAGNTILHEAATSNSTTNAAREMLNKAPELLSLSNFLGETPIFRAARYGKTRVFEFLATEVDKVCARMTEEHRIDAFFRRMDGTTILHISILAEHFVVSRKGDKTEGGDNQGLHVCKPVSFISDLAKSCWRSPILEAVRKEKARYESAAKLAELLIPNDTSWKLTNPREDRSKPRTHRYGPRTSLNEKGLGRDGLQSLSVGNEEKETPQGQSQESKKSSFTEREGGGGEEEDYTTPIIKTGETPLFLATMSGIREIVEQILDVHPQAIEHINNRGKNILHVAVKYRQIEIFNLVVNNEMLARRLVRKTDEWGNSILHMVGKKRSGYIAEKIQSPALQLQKELLLFERVKEVSKTYFIKHLNENKQTPEELFAKTYSDLHNSATDWLKRTSENCTIVAVLIATVAFAAAYTIPGGPNQSTGLPLLLSQPFFVIFTLTDVISLTFALTSVVTFLSILTSSFRLQDFKNSLPQKLMLGFTFLILSVSMMMVAFAATIVLMIRNKERWTKIVLYSVAFLPVTLFAISYSPLYLSLLEACKYPLKLILKACPRCNCFPLQPWINNKSFEDNSIRGDSSSIKPHKSHPNRTPV